MHEPSRLRSPSHEPRQGNPGWSSQRGEEEVQRRRAAEPSLGLAVMTIDHPFPPPLPILRLPHFPPPPPPRRTLHLPSIPVIISILKGVKNQ